MAAQWDQPSFASVAGRRAGLSSETVGPKTLCRSTHDTDAAIAPQSVTLRTPLTQGGDATGRSGQRL
jgi:hypothetical protein